VALGSGCGGSRVNFATDMPPLGARLVSVDRPLLE
jgi:hypothetical protein